MRRLLISAAAAIIAALLVLIGFELAERRYDWKRDRELAAMAARCPGTPAEAAAKEFTSFNGAAVRSTLAPLPLVLHSWETRAGARRFLDNIEETMRAGLDWKHPVPALTIPATRHPPVIDGLIAPGEWDDAWTVQGEYETDSAQWSDSPARWYLKYDTRNLYFAAYFPDSDQVFQNRRHPYFDDSFELFLLPDLRLHTYYELVFTPDGREYIRRVCQGPASKYDLEEFRPATLDWQVSRTPDGYSFEGAIGFLDLPGYLLGNPPQPGESLRWLMLRTDRSSANAFRKTAPFPFFGNGHNLNGYARGRFGDSTLGSSASIY